MKLAATVLIPTHDHGPTLLRSVPSALAQTVSDLEVLVVGDGVPDQTREIMGELTASDERVRFFDNPKGPRSGELHRYDALREARGEIVCYLSDDDLWLPDHLEEMRALLAEADLAHTLSFSIDTSGGFHVARIDLARGHYRDILLSGDSRIHHSVTGHTLELYRSLPEGWRTTPAGIHVDLYMWQQMLSLPSVRVITGTRPTVLHFPDTLRTAMSIEERVAELDSWADPELAREVQQRVLDVVAPDRAGLEEAVWHEEQRVLGLRRELEALERDNSELRAWAADLQSQLDRVASSVTWRLRELLVRLPGLRAAARALAGRAAPAAAAPARPAPRSEPTPPATGSPAPDPPSDSPARRSDPSTR